MSVICQNFVQNAWKKDLCSNCFKSFGDHEQSEGIQAAAKQEQVSHQATLNGVRSETSFKSYETPKRHNSITPQTTWKSLIAQKNEKNTQLFKLETGFHGRLLTINTATNVNDSKTTNGCTSKISKCDFSDRNTKTADSQRKVPAVATSEKEISSGKQIVNGGHASPSSESKCNLLLKKTGSELANGYAQERISDDKTNKNGYRPFQSILKNKLNSNDAKDIVNGITNGSIQENGVQKRLHGILKKSSCSGTDIKAQRSPGVGFKDEDPEVIGYGGRDFSPDELEWEIASSDGEGGGAVSDETEDDRAFSELTKENTEFNSDNKNLLQENIAGENHDHEVIQNSDNDKVADDEFDRCSVSNENKSSTGDQENPDSPVVKITSSPGDLESSFSQANSTISDQMLESAKIYVNTENGECAGEEEEFTDTPNKVQENESIDEIAEKSQAKISSVSYTVEKGSAEDSANGSAAVAETVYVKTADITGNARDTSRTNDASATEQPVPTVVAKNNKGGRAAEAAEFGNAERKETELVDDFEADKKDCSRALKSGHIHEAVNTALASQHRMEYESKRDLSAPISNVPDDAARKELNEENNENDAANAGNQDISSKTSSGKDAEAGDADDAVSGSNDSSERDAESPTEISQEKIQPRSSFLHGLRSNYGDHASKPSAIYSPGSDFFVKRSSSSSSSSSDDARKSQEILNTITCDSDETDLENGDNTNGTITESEADDFKEATKDATNLSTENEDSQRKVPPPVAKTKPKVPEKPRKPNVTFRTCASESGHYAKPSSKPEVTAPENNEIKNDSNDVYYSVAEGPGSSPASTPSECNYYAETNIYHELDGKTITNIPCNATKDGTARESKLAALAVELEQARHAVANGNFKRQAPSPPKTSDSLSEDSVRSLERTPSPADHQHSSSFREGNPFSSASSTTSSSSQDDPGFGSWSLHGDSDESRKSSKWKNSFLMSQYSKCKMLAMNYNEDRFKSRKKFSLKKLLKIGKDSEFPVSGSGHGHENSQKAWKFSENFERPRAKLEIIHPMDLENKSVTVNPGFHPVRSNSTSSFTSGVEVVSIRHSTSSDYGSYYSDAVSSVDSPAEKTYEYITPENGEANVTVSSSGRGTPCSALNPSGSTSPTPSRCSATSQASTLTSGSSKTGGFYGHPARPPKPPPPPRAHSLLPGNKRNSSSCKFPTGEIHSSSENSASEEPKPPAVQESESKPEKPQKPQAPKRLYRAANVKQDYSGIDTKVTVAHRVPDTDLACRSALPGIVPNDSATADDESPAEENPYECVQTDIADAAAEPYEDVGGAQSSEKESKTSAEVNKPSSSLTVNLDRSTIIRCVDVQSKTQQEMITKAPSRPPPIYSKLPNSVAIARENPWKTLEGSYTALSANNRDVLSRIVEQGVSRRPSMKLKGINNFEWQDVKLDPCSRPLFFALGDKVTYDAMLTKMGNYMVTLLISLQIPVSNPSYQYKHPVLGHFLANIPGHLVLEDSRTDLELQSIPAFVYVLQRSEVSNVEDFINDMPDVLTESLEKEICFLLLQVIQELKGLQAQGIEEIEPNFNNLLLSKTSDDVYYNLVFLAHSFFEDPGNAYSLVLEECKVSLCQFALMLLFQLFKVESVEELAAIGGLKFTKPSVTKVFENTAKLLSEEKAVSLSQVKTLLECFMWGLQTLILRPDFDPKEIDVILYRWIDIERSNFIKNVVTNALTHINVQAELHSQFLLRSNVKNIKDVIPYL